VRAFPLDTGVAGRNGYFPIHFLIHFLILKECALQPYADYYLAG
jgi:hypothetical protein